MPSPPRWRVADALSPAGTARGHVQRPERVPLHHFRTAAATLTALFLALVAGPAVIRRLAALRVGQPIREIGPDHQAKAGTPTMGAS